MFPGYLFSAYLYAVHIIALFSINMLADLLPANFLSWLLAFAFILNSLIL